MADDRPKHKPQKKHTLEEVLKSLQDLIRNDLIAAQRGGSGPALPALNAPPPAATDAFDTALDTLDHLIDHELIEPAQQARTAPPAADDDLPPDDENWPDDDTLINESLAADEAFSVTDDAGKDLAPEERTVPTEPAAPRGAQNTFAFEAPPAGASNGADESPAPDTDIEPTTDDESNATDMPPRAHSARSLPEDDIPVLHEVAHEILAAADGALPTPEQAREIAVHVVARLNIELRKGGAAPLDPSTIDRLQQLLREALASKSSGNS